ncbi:putative glycosidase crf1 [Cytospora mali]|uniref:Crh-like protein n=1 Tax=Cytospora mali TaxID=578113 RepID=A0A194VZV0_CYTMA|nr:putative glycosidase crf1 [Valsa mali]
MISRLASATAMVLAASSLASAQTYSLCNPVEKTGCPADPAVGTTKTIDFTKGANDFFTAAEGTTVKYDDKLGAVFSINKETDAPTFTSTGYIFFGKVDVTVRASLGVGVVTSFVLQSDDLDEIDWEWLGGDNTEVQTNYFSKGNTTTYDRGGFSGVGSPVDEFHTYTIDWNAERLNWIIDGTVVRTLTYADAYDGVTYPQTPMQIKLGTWVAGRKDAAVGTVEWAGGYTDFSKAPFMGYYKSVVVQDYMNGADSAKQYVYGDKTGTYKSIKIENTESSSDSSSAQSASATSTSTGKKAASTLSTVTSSGTTTSGITLATGEPKSSSSSSSSSDSSSSASTGTSTASSSSSSSSTVTASAGNKSAVNFAFLGAALFAFLSL